MLVKNNIAEPGEIKSVALDTHRVEVRLRSGEVMRYERKPQEAPVLWGKPVLLPYEKRLIEEHPAAGQPELKERIQQMVGNE